VESLPLKMLAVGVPPNMGELFGDAESLPLKTLPVEVPPNMGELRCSESRRAARAALAA
jgi:hypothetical protein